MPVQHGQEPDYKELSSKVLQQLRQLYRSVHTIIIDEISMVSANTLTSIHRRLCTLKQNTDFFGGLNIIVIGDFYQLKPVRGRFAFHNTILWDLFQPFILHVNMRQQNACEYRDLLNRIRIGKVITSDVQTLTTRLIDANDNTFEGALRIFPTRNEVYAYNREKQLTFNANIITVQAHHSFTSDDMNSKSSDNDTESYVPEDDRTEAGGLPRILQFTLQTRVMLLRNIATDQGLVNGALGFIQHIEYEDNSPIAIYVRCDDPNIGQIGLLRNQDHNAIPIEMITQQFHSRGRSLSRTQFPLAPAWACTCTIHKVQGITCDKIVIDLGKKSV